MFHSMSHIAQYEFFFFLVWSPEKCWHFTYVPTHIQQFKNLVFISEVMSTKLWWSFRIHSIKPIKPIFAKEKYLLFTSRRKYHSHISHFINIILKLPRARFVFIPCEHPGWISAELNLVPQSNCDILAA